MDIKLISCGDRVTLQMTGRFDSGVSMDFFLMTAKAMVKHSSCDIEIDLEGVSYIDSSGLGKLIHLSQQLDEKGRRLIIVKPQHSVRKALDMFQLSKLMTIV